MHLDPHHELIQIIVKFLRDLIFFIFFAKVRVELRTNCSKQGAESRCGEFFEREYPDFSSSPKEDEEPHLTSLSREAFPLHNK